MVRKSKTHETVKVALEVIKRIPRTRKVSTTDLQEQLTAAGFEVEPRTVQNLLKQLRENFDIDCDESSKPYGYKWKEGSSGLTVVSLTAQESLLLTLAQEQLKHLLPQSVMRSLNSFFEQARANLLHGSNTKSEKAWLSKVQVVSETQPLLPPSISSQVLEEVSFALYGNHWLELRYRNAQGQVKNHHAMPLGLVQKGPRLYLIAQFDGLERQTNLAVHRIVSATSSTLTFDRPSGFNLKQYLTEGRLGVGSGASIRLSFEISERYGKNLLETPLSTDQVVAKTEHGYLIQASVSDNDQLDCWLRGYGTEVKHINKEILK